MSQDLYGWAYLVAQIATLLGVLGAFINSLRNGKKIDVQATKIEAQHETQKDIASSLFAMTGKVVLPPKDKQT
jgi:hypothetical protein